MRARTHLIFTVLYVILGMANFIIAMFSFNWMSLINIAIAISMMAAAVVSFRAYRKGGTRG